MRMIRTSSSIFCVCTFALVYAPASANELPWPKTFVGQPDFDYTRTQVIEEYQKKKGLEAQRYIANMTTLMKERTIDPFTPTPITTDIGRSKYSKEVFEQRFGLKEQMRTFRSVYPDITVGTGLELTRTDGTLAKAELTGDNTARLLKSSEQVEIVVAPNGEIIEKRAFEKTIAETFDNLFLKSADIQRNSDEKSPQVDDVKIEQTDVMKTYNISVNILQGLEEISEDDKSALDNYASFIQNVITQATKRQRGDVDRTKLRQHVGGIVLQSIVSSPLKYAIVNGKRYQVGGRIPLDISVSRISANEVEKIINAYMPKEETVSKKTYASYVTLREEALKQYKTQLENTEDTETQVVHAVVTDIDRRRVTLNVLGEIFEIEMKFTL